MKYKFLENIADEKFVLPESEKINNFLLKNHEAEIYKALDFFNTDEKLLHVHGFVGTGKRQFINYVSDFLNHDTLVLEYYCKQATVYDDILISFINILEKHSESQIMNKITMLSTKFLQYVSSIKRPIVIILHSVDDILETNISQITSFIQDLVQFDNIKIVVSTRAMVTPVIKPTENYRKIFLKALSKNIFTEFLESNGIKANEATIEEFYKHTRGYYYYVALSIKILQAMKYDLREFLSKFKESGMTFDAYIGVTYINLIPNTIRNFFWFIRTIRHGLSFNALAVFEIYDEFSIEYLKSNLMIFQVDECLYVQSYFSQKIDISIPPKTEIRLHKYIVNIYEKQLKENVATRAIQISRQAMRAEIEYHNSCIKKLKNGENVNTESKVTDNTNISSDTVQSEENLEVDVADTKDFSDIKKLIADKKYTEAIEGIQRQLNSQKFDLNTVAELRLRLANLYKIIDNYSMAGNYYGLVELYYKKHNETINLCYLYYEMTDLYNKMYNHDRAIETAKRVIYSVDTPQHLMVRACTLLGSIYSEIKDYTQAYEYYKKALESIDEKADGKVLSELYFKYALANDDSGKQEIAFEYYTKCIAMEEPNEYKALAYSNMGSCYYENESYDEAKNCFLKAYELEKGKNNYEGIYYNASHLAKIYGQENADETLNYLLEAQKNAEFLNDEKSLIESSIELGDYYYNIPDKLKECLIEYLKALKLIRNANPENIANIQKRIEDMKVRLGEDEFKLIYEKYN